MKEKDLFPVLKQEFKNMGYTVYAEVPILYRSVDFVAVKGKIQIAVEMKLHFNRDVIKQATINTVSFLKSYVAFPVKKARIFSHEKDSRFIHKYIICKNQGVGILEVCNQGFVFEALEAKEQNINKPYDFSCFQENETDEAGIPCKKGVSEANYELKLIKKYINKNPNTTWEEIYNNVQNHYSTYKSMANSMRIWKGFSLTNYKKEKI